MSHAQYGAGSAAASSPPSDLTDKITSFAIRYNSTARPFTWTYDKQKRTTLPR